VRIPGSDSTPLSSLSVRARLGLGSAAAVLGAAVIVLSPVLGWADLSRPWSFLVGLTAGLVSGAGAAVAVCGLLAARGRR
jgi:hypothetical protein